MHRCGPFTVLRLPEFQATISGTEERAAPEPDQKYSSGESQSIWPINRAAIAETGF